MHPEIEKFFLTIYECTGKLEDWSVLVGLKGNRYHTIGSYTKDSVSYYINGKSYTESEMLKVIKIKAFL